MTTEEKTTIPPPPPAVAAAAFSAINRSTLEYCLIFVLLAFMVLLCFSQYMNPDFEIQSVSIDIENNKLLVNSSRDPNQPATAVWDIGFTIKNSNAYVEFNFTDIDVLIECTSLGWSGASVEPFVQGPESTTLVNVTINALLPFYDRPPRAALRGLVLDFQVLFRARFDDGYRAQQSWCKDMRIEFLENNGTKGVLVEGPKSCHVEYNAVGSYHNTKNN